MKVLLTLLILMSGFGFSQSLQSVSISELEQLQENEGKPVIIHFKTDWCAVCKVESYQLNKNKELVNMINRDFYWVDINPEQYKSKIIWKNKTYDYLANGKSGIHSWVYQFTENRPPAYPLWVFLDKNLDVIFVNEGKLDIEILNQIKSRILVNE